MMLLFAQWFLKNSYCSTALSFLKLISEIFAFTLQSAQFVFYKG